MGAQMGLISSIAPLLVQPSKAVLTDASTSGAHLPSGVSALRISAVAPVQPVNASANSEAIVRDHLAAQGGERQNEVDGVKLDMIPFVDDGAILLDDVPVILPEPPQKPVETPPESLPAAIVQAKAADHSPEAEDAAKADAAERAYQDEREVSKIAKPVDSSVIDHVDLQKQTAEPANLATPPLDLVM